MNQSKYLSLLRLHENMRQPAGKTSVKQGLHIFFCISGKTSALVSAFLAKFNFVIDAMAAVPHNKHNAVRGGRL